MARVRTVVLSAAIASAVLCGCGASSGGVGSGKLRGDEVEGVLRALPFKTHVETVTPPTGDDAAFRGTANRAGVEIRFSIGVGNLPVPVPIPGLGTRRAIGEGELGFSFNTDANYADAFKTGAEWYKATPIATEIEESLCKKVTGRPCPV